MAWFGADPGGKGAFGVAALNGDGSFVTHCLSSVDEALEEVTEATAIGIDCPMWWTSTAGGGRNVDEWLRRTYKIRSGTVQSVNSLQGAVLIQGVMLAYRLREKFPSIRISETHPKALRKALHLEAWGSLVDRFGIYGDEPKTDHETDALVGAIVVREAEKKRWKDLSTDRGPRELDPKKLWFGPVTYWWPDGSEA